MGMLGKSKAELEQEAALKAQKAAEDKEIDDTLARLEAKYGTTPAPIAAKPQLGGSQEEPEPPSNGLLQVIKKRNEQLKNIK